MISIERILLTTLLVAFAVNVFAVETGLKTTDNGKAPGRGLKMKKSKVPTFEIHSAKGGIPRLEVGVEATLEAAALTPLSATVPESHLKPVSRQPQIPLVDFDARKAGITTATTPKNVVDGKPMAIPEVKALVTIPDPTVQESKVEAQKLRELSPAESRLLEAQISLESHDSPDTALGLLVDLLDDKMVATEARYTYALAARKLGLHSEFRSWLMKIAVEGKSKEWSKIATEALAREVEALEINDMKILHDLVTKYEVETDGNDAYNFYRAKYFLETGDLGQVEDALKYIPEKSKYTKDALMISALSSYRTGKIDKAATDLQMLISKAEKSDSLYSIAALTLARIQFQKGQYKEAFQSYLKVDRGSHLWLQAMVEQAWAQILTEDYEGAAGNMFSLHTDFFKNAFAPESYTVRSVAYLNLCQYGDGIQVLSNLRNKYGPVIGRLMEYQKSKTSPQDYYETVRTWLKNSEQKVVDGLPRSYIVELARHPSFMKAQMQINNFEDEIEAFNKANLALIQKEKDLIKRQNDIKGEIAKVRELKNGGKVSAAQLKVDTDGFERKLASLKAQHQLANRARGFIKDARVRAQARIEKEKVVLKEKASVALKKRFELLIADLTHVLEQNEVLQYETLAGAGEHLRSQSAGAEANTKERTQLKPEADKSVKWKFKGEIWEDEVGHYRSSLKNVCPKDDKVAAY